MANQNDLGRKCTTRCTPKIVTENRGKPQQNTNTEIEHVKKKHKNTKTLNEALFHLLSMSLLIGGRDHLKYELRHDSQAFHNKVRTM